MSKIKIDFKRQNAPVPCIIQDSVTNKVLMLGYMNEEALEKTLTENRVTFFSRSKQRLWTKGETSGNYLTVKEILTDCDGDTILIKAIPNGPVCHTGSDTCFNESNKDWSLQSLEQVIQDRKQNPGTGSYTNNLFDEGLNRIAQKVGEEAVELVIASKDNNQEAFTKEAADLIYHTLVLLCMKGVTIDDVVEVLEMRHRSH
jgi:phosphoribosyl-ATP pyrophosphohydrolase/phosphoribosyl-AMP cyclohydrolase